MRKRISFHHRGGVPFPYDPYDGAEPIVTLNPTNGIYEVEDNTDDWNLLTAAQELDAVGRRTMSADSPDPTGGDGTDTNGSGGDFSPGYQPLVFNSNDLWIELKQLDFPDQTADLTLHGTVEGESYQLLSTNTLPSSPQNWTLGPVVGGASNTNQTDILGVSIGANSQMFFRAHHSDNEVYIQANSENVIQPNPTTGDPGQIGTFTIYSLNSISNDLTVYYSVSGTASPGIDYSNLTGVAVIPATGLQKTNVQIVPLYNPVVHGPETVTLTLQTSDSYLIDPMQFTATLLVENSSETVGMSSPNGTDATRPDGPPGEPAVIGQFELHRDDERFLYPQLPVYYVIGGTASNGVDYELLTNVIVFQEGYQSTNIDVTPLSEAQLQGIKTVTVTLVPTNTYQVITGEETESLNIVDTSTTVSISGVQNAKIGNGTPGIFAVSRTDDTRPDLPPITVNYLISGTASNGLDYQLLNGTATFADGSPSTNIFINPIERGLFDPNLTVTLTIITNGAVYYVNPGASNATLSIDRSITFFTVASGLNGPNGLDYYAPSNCLMVTESRNGTNGTIDMIFTNMALVDGQTVTNVSVTNWSGITNLEDEVYLVAPRIPSGVLTNSAGFTNGDLFFGSGTGIGWLSAGATQSNFNWCILTNSEVTNALLLRGGICEDQTGTFSNDLIAVTSSDVATIGPKGVWIIDSQAHPRLIKSINTRHLEGVKTLTNDLQTWGPWAGKIITGDEDELNIYTIDTSGNVVTYPTTNLIAGGISPESFDVIPTNSPFYFTDFKNDRVVGIPDMYLRAFVGDLLVTQSGEESSPGIFIIHWNSQGSNFVTTTLPLPSNIHIEGGTFAPVQFPSQ